MTKKCFMHGEVLNASGAMRADVLVEGGKIVAVGDARAFHLAPDDEKIDCSGCFILPGLIDAHCHIQLNTGIFGTQDDWWLGSQEAARGGITTVIDFVDPKPGQSLKDALKDRQKQAEISLVDHTFHMTVTRDDAATLEEIGHCAQWGLSSLKLYTTYKPNYYLSDEALVNVLEAASAARLTVLIHCECNAMVTHQTAKVGTDNVWRDYAEMRPPEAESEAVRRVIALANYTDARVVIAHNSCAETLRIVQEAKRHNPNIFNETAPQYLLLDKHLNQESPEPWRYILQPPLRDSLTALEMRLMMLEDAADMFITDHCAYTREQKLHDPNGTPGGLPGFETLLPALAGGLEMPLCKIVRNLSENPAKIYGLWPHKGAVAPGFDADLVLLKDEHYRIDEAKLHTFAGYSPFHGCRGRGVIQRVYLRGEEIVCQGQIKGERGFGQFVPAMPVWAYEED